MSSKEEVVRNKIVSKHLLNLTLSNQKLAKKLNISRSTVNDILNRLNERLTTSRKPGSRKKPGPVHPEKDQKIVKIYNKNPNISVQSAAKKIKMSAFYILGRKTKFVCKN